MHVAARVGIAAVTAGAVGFGAFKLNELVAERDTGDHAKLDQAVAAQSKAWDSWKGRLDAEFPGGRLETPADHARLEAFLRDNPEPSWISVEHDDYTRLRLGIDEQIVDTDLLPETEREKGIGYAGIGALGMLGMGGAALVAGLRSSSSSLGTIGKLVGGAAGAAAGAGMVALLVGDVVRGTNMDGYRELVTRVRPHMG